MVSHCNVPAVCSQPLIDFSFPAKAMEPRQRQDLALQALAGTETIRGPGHPTRGQPQVHLSADQHGTGGSPGGIRRPARRHDEGSLPPSRHQTVVKSSDLGADIDLPQFHSRSLRVLPRPPGLPHFHWHGHNVLQGEVQQARLYNRQQDLSGIRIGAHDEIFQSGQPVLVGADVQSTYCYLLGLEQHRDAETWGIRLLELQDRGFRPEATIADAGSGLRAGQALAMPATPCRGDVFHALHLVQPLATFLENRAYEAIAHKATLTHKSQKAQKARTARQRPRRHPLASEESFAEQLRLAAQTQAQAIDLAADVGTLFDWLRCDILSLAGADYARARTVRLCGGRTAGSPTALPTPYRSGRQRLERQGDDLLAFAAQLDRSWPAWLTAFSFPLPQCRGVQQ